MNDAIIELPIIVNMDVIENNNVYELDVDSLLQEYELSLESQIIVETSGVDKYLGPYQVVPLAFDDQTLETKDKLCTEDIIVEKVPLWETSNLSGGYTVYIAERL